MNTLTGDLSRRAADARRLLTLVRMTLERRFRPDEVVDNAIDATDTELILLEAELKKKRL